MTQLRCYISKFLGKESRKSMAIISISCKKNFWRTSVWQCDYYELHWRVIAPGTCGNGRIKLGAEPGNMLIPTVIWSAAQSTRSPALPRRRFLHALPRSTLTIVMPWAHASVNPISTPSQLEISLTHKALCSAAASFLVTRNLHQIPTSSGWTHLAPWSAVDRIPVRLISMWKISGPCASLGTMQSAPVHKPGPTNWQILTSPRGASMMFAVRGKWVRINLPAKVQRSRMSAASFAPVMFLVTTFKPLFQANLGCNSGCWC